MQKRYPMRKPRKTHQRCILMLDWPVGALAEMEEKLHGSGIHTLTIPTPEKLLSILSEQTPCTIVMDLVTNLNVSLILCRMLTKYSEAGQINVLFIVENQEFSLSEIFRGLVDCDFIARKDLSTRMASAVEASIRRLQVMAKAVPRLSQPLMKHQKIRTVRNLDDDQDFWLLGHESDLKMAMNHWIIYLLGPGNADGSWEKVSLGTDIQYHQVVDLQEEHWQFVLKTTSPFYSARGRWVFQGKRPSFEKYHWVFSGASPRLVFLEKKEFTLVRITTQTHGILQVASNNPKTFKMVPQLGQSLRAEIKNYIFQEDRKNKGSWEIYVNSEKVKELLHREREISKIEKKFSVVTDEAEINSYFLELQRSFGDVFLWQAQMSSGGCAGKAKIDLASNQVTVDLNTKHDFKNAQIMGKFETQRGSTFFLVPEIEAPSPNSVSFPAPEKLHIVQRRAALRCKVFSEFIDAEVQVGGVSFLGRVWDISASGISLVLGRNDLAGKIEEKISIRFDWEGEQFHIQGFCKHQKNLDFGGLKNLVKQGVVFTEISPWDIQRINNIIYYRLFKLLSESRHSLKKAA